MSHAKATANPVRVTRRTAMLSSLGCLGILAGQPASAETPLAGRKIRFLLPTEVGADAYARPFAERMRKLFPEATIAVQNEVAAGGKLAAKMLFENAGGDITIGLLNSGLLFAQLLGEEGVSYDFRKFRWIGSMTDDRRVLMVGKHTGVASLDELRNRQLIFGVNTLASSSSYDARLLNAVLGIKLRIVPGFKTSERLKGIIAGEIDAVGGSYASLHTLISGGDARVVLRYTGAALPGEAMKAPLLRDLAGDGWKGRIANMLETNSRMGRPIAASPAISESDLAVLRSAFDQITADESYRAEMQTLEAPIDAEPGQAVEASMETVLGESQKLSAELKAAISCGLEISEGTRQACEI